MKNVIESGIKFTTDHWTKIYGISYNSNLIDTLNVKELRNAEVLKVLKI